MNLPDWNPLAFLSRLFPDEFPFSTPPAAALITRRLDWDAAFFGADMHRIAFLSEEASIDELTSGLSGIRGHLMAEVPSEAKNAIRLLSATGFQLVETRLNYFHSLQNLPDAGKACRPAMESDVPALRRTASGARNDFDRYHTDPFFSEEAASSYLETYAENCIRGLAEMVFVPDLPEAPASFAALARAEYPGQTSGNWLYRIPLTACLPENKGWHYHLCLAAMQEAKRKNAIALVMTTQAANRAVIHNCEKLGFRLGSAFHIFSKEQ